MTDKLQLEQITQLLMADNQILPTKLTLQIGDCIIAVSSNSQPVLDLLRHYFRHIVLSDDNGNPEAVADIEVVALQQAQTDLNLQYKDWTRETGKSGRKDSYYDCDGGRLVYKVRTGMLFVQSAQLRIASGDCLSNDNQVINFINAQFMNWLQQRDWLICHAAAIEYQGKAIAIAAFSGGGKSTSMLHLMDLPGCHFLTNDRLFISKQPNSGAVQVAGVPKLPRINPGTIVNNPALENILTPQRRQQLLSLPKQELWQLEEKYDVDVLETYGNDRITHLAELDALLILNWQRDAGPMTVTPVNLDQNRNLLQALMKSPGPFYQKTNGEFYTDNTPLNQQSYIDILSSANVFEIKGGVDFEALVRWCEPRLR